jgi:hypothetical protein
VTARIIEMPRRGNMPSSIYRMIWQAVRERRQIAFAYEGRPREACPLILGYSADGKEVVFAYQVGGRTSKGGKLPAWRCFYLSKISALATREGEWREDDSHTQTQSCVRQVDVDANIPDTLTRPQPLPFGSPQLQPPRAGKESI